MRKHFYEVELVVANDRAEKRMRDVYKTTRPCQNSQNPPLSSARFHGFYLEGMSFSVEKRNQNRSRKQLSSSERLGGAMDCQ